MNMREHKVDERIIPPHELRLLRIGDYATAAQTRKYILIKPTTDLKFGEGIQAPTSATNIHCC